MPYEEIDGYIKKVNETFTDLDPLYVISGDTDLNEEISCSIIESKSITTWISTELFTNLHVRGRLMEIPEKLIKQMDFYMFQSGIMQSWK